jgi:hypothetical protein
MAAEPCYSRAKGLSSNTQGLGKTLVIPQESGDSSNVSNHAPIASVYFSQPELSTELYVRASAVVSRLIAGETLVLPVKRNVGDLTSLFSFNGTGATIWDALETPKSLQDICDVIDRKYDLSKEKAEEDVKLFVRELCSLGLAKALAEPENTPAIGNDKSGGKIIAPE